MKLTEFFKRRRVAYTGTTATITALVLALFYLFNLVVLGLANHFTWYFHTGEEYDLSISDAAAELFADIDTEEGGVEIIFCDLEQNIASHKQLDFVYKTATAMQEKYPELIRISYVNLWLEPDRVADYYKNENGTENTINSSTVIIDYQGKFLVNPAASYYVLDRENYVVSYSGEEELVSNILWVTAKEHPVAYFTANHGEEIPTALYRSLIRAGYMVDRIDLATEASVPEDAGLLVISSPLYDFQRSAAGSAFESEIYKLESYLAKGGQMLVTLDPGRVEGLPRLCGFLEENGIKPEAATVIDGQNALPGSAGYSLITSFGDGALSLRLSAHATKEGRRTVLSAALPLAATESSKATVEPFLFSSDAATVQAADGQAISHGRTALAMAATRREGGGQLFVLGSAYLTDVELMHARGYGNSQLVYAILSEMGADRVPLGIASVAVDRSAIEDLTLGEADLYAFLSAVLIPLILVTAGLVIRRKRKNH